jgi:hemolysin activation/secretion protein
MVSPIQGFTTICCAFATSQLFVPAVLAQVVGAETANIHETEAAVVKPQTPEASPLAQADNQLRNQALPDELLPSPDLGELNAPDDQADQAQQNTKFRVNRFEFAGNTRFKSEELATVTAAFVGREITFSEMLQARSAITKFYNDAGYVTTGAIISPQTMQNGVVKIQILEGKLEEIQVSGNTRLRAKYIRDRLEPDGDGPLNVPQLLEDLQLLRLDPRIANISADLQAGVRPGSNLLKVDIQEADTFKTNVTLDNSRSPSVGSFRRKAQFVEANLLGFGDTLSVGYTNTKGSNGWDFSYTLPINSKDGNVWFNYGSTKSNVIERPFTALDIQAKSRYYELGLRQPLVQKPTQELALGLLFSRQESQTELGIDNIGPFPLSPGADAEGRTRVSALRFFQEYTQRSEQHVFALRSQFSFGLPWFGSNINDDAPDSKFFAWRGQGQWLRQLAPETQFLVKSDIQLAGSSLLPLEQFGLGGQMTVRGYRQDALLTDSGALVSAEFRLPIVRGRRAGNVLQLTPFLDLGTAWNMNGNNAANNTLVGTGIGLLWKQGGFSARVDWGIPLTRLEGEKRTLQDRGLYFSLNYTPF